MTICSTTWWATPGSVFWSRSSSTAPGGQRTERGTPLSAAPGPSPRRTVGQRLAQLQQAAERQRSHVRFPPAVRLLLHVLLKLDPARRLLPLQLLVLVQHQLVQLHEHLRRRGSVGCPAAQRGAAPAPHPTPPRPPIPVRHPPRGAAGPTCAAARSARGAPYPRAPPAPWRSSAPGAAARRARPQSGDLHGARGRGTRVGEGGGRSRAARGGRRGGAAAHRRREGGSGEPSREAPPPLPAPRARPRSPRAPLRAPPTPPPPSDPTAAGARAPHALFM